MMIMENKNKKDKCSNANNASYSDLVKEYCRDEIFISACGITSEDELANWLMNVLQIRSPEARYLSADIWQEKILSEKVKEYEREREEL